MTPVPGTSHNVPIRLFAGDQETVGSHGLSRKPRVNDGFGFPHFGVHPRDAIARQRYDHAMNSATVGVVIVFVIVGIVVVFAVRTVVRRNAQNAADHVIASFQFNEGALRLTASELIEGYGEEAPRHPVSGLTASVEDSGTVNRRLTATRMLLLGPLSLAVPKKLDDRELFLTIEGPTTGLLRSVTLKDKSASTGAAVRRFAMAINTAARVVVPESPEN